MWPRLRLPGLRWRLCIEIDISQDLPSRVFIQVSSRLIAQPVIYEDLPLYCTSCYRLGRNALTCGKIDPPKQHSGADLVDKRLQRSDKEPSQRWTPKKPQPGPSDTPHPQDAKSIPGAYPSCTDMTRLPSVSYAQDTSRLQGIDDSMLNDLPANHESFSFSDDEVELVPRRTHFLDAPSDDALASFICDQIQAVFIDTARQDTLTDSLDTLADDVLTSVFQVRSKLLRRWHKPHLPISPPFTRSRAAFSNSFDILSYQ